MKEKNMPHGFAFRRFRRDKSMKNLNVKKDKTRCIPDFYPALERGNNTAGGIAGDRRCAGASGGGSRRFSSGMEREYQVAFSTAYMEHVRDNRAGIDSPSFCGKE